MDNILGEFLGTAVLIIFGCGVNANISLKKTYGYGGGWICTTAGWCFAVLFGVFTAKALGASQADINPAVTFAKMLSGLYTFKQFAITTIAQVAGGIVGGIIVYLAYLSHWADIGDSITKRGVFCTSPAVRNITTAFITECIATFFLVFVIWLISSKHNDPLPNWLSPYFVGLLVWTLGLSLGGPTGYAINPARDLGPRIAYAILPIPNKADADWNYAWVPVFAPMCGGMLAYFAVSLLGLIIK